MAEQTLFDLFGSDGEEVMEENNNPATEAAANTSEEIEKMTKVENEQNPDNEGTDDKGTTGKQENEHESEKSEDEGAAGKEKKEENEQETGDDDTAGGEKKDNEEEQEIPSLLPQSEQIKTGTKTPVFQYADIKEELKKLDVTFEDLRKKYAADFPELEKKEKVTYKVEYAYTRMCKPTEKLADVKAEMEKDKRFTDQLKKLKSPLQMTIKPIVSGQTKGYRQQTLNFPALNKKINALVQDAIEEAALDSLYSQLQIQKLKNNREYFNLKLWEFYNQNEQTNEGEDYEYSEKMNISDMEYLKEVLFKEILNLPTLKTSKKVYSYYPKDIA